MAYLSSNMIKGIGPVTARNIVEKFGMRIFYVLDHTQKELLKVRGITESKLQCLQLDMHKAPIFVEEVKVKEEDSTIIQNEDKINANRMDLRFDDTFYFYPAADAVEASKIIQKVYREEPEKKGDTDAVQVLSLLRKDTEAGSDALNVVLRDIVNPRRRGYPDAKNGKMFFRLSDKVIQIKNNDEVSNGDVGSVLDIYTRRMAWRKCAWTLGTSHHYWQ